jgi:hypothetical protein
MAKGCILITKPVIMKRFCLDSGCRRVQYRSGVPALWGDYVWWFLLFEKPKAMLP